MQGRSLLVSDLDGTLLGDDESLERFAAWYQARRDRFRLVYSSGRFIESVVEVIDATSLPEPDAVIGGVGTEIHNYPEAVAVDGWPRCAGRWDPRQIRDVLAGFEGLEMQPLEYQSEFKLSYYGGDLTPSFLAALRRRLVMAGCDAELIYSSNRDLDVLPLGVHKGSAVSFLAARWQFLPSQVLVSGDTGNDLSMFMRGFRGIVVANAREELRALESPEVYHCQRPYAAGVLEGLQHWLKEAA